MANHHQCQVWFSWNIYLICTHHPLWFQFYFWSHSKVLYAFLILLCFDLSNQKPNIYFHCFLRYVLLLYQWSDTKDLHYGYFHNYQLFNCNGSNVVNTNIFVWLFVFFSKLQSKSLILIMWSKKQYVRFLMFICLIFPIYVNNLLLDRHNRY